VFVAARARGLASGPVRVGLANYAAGALLMPYGRFIAAARVERHDVERLQRQAIREPLLLNVNVPDVPYEQLQGTLVTHLGKRHKAEPVVRTLTPRNETVYWVGAAGAEQDAGEGTDFHAVKNNRVSITPLQIDLTHNAQLPVVRNWLSL